MPSPRDAQMTMEEGAIWIIVGMGILGYWRAVKGGPIYNAFEPINCDLLPDGCTTVAPSPEET